MGARMPSKVTVAPAWLVASLPVASVDALTSVAGPIPVPYSVKIIPGDTAPVALLAAFVSAPITGPLLARFVKWASTISPPPAAGATSVPAYCFCAAVEVTGRSGDNVFPVAHRPPDPSRESPH